VLVLHGAPQTEVGGLLRHLLIRGPLLSAAGRADRQYSVTFTAWRLVHRTCTGIAGVLAIVHVLLTARLYDGWSPDALWFLLSGLGLLLLTTMNWAHVGLEPCQLPTAPAVKWANVVYMAAGVAALLAVPQPHAMVLVGALAGQTVAGFQTLRPTREPDA
jgi:hypothetical protein